MSKLGRFAAACVAVVCAFGTMAADNPFAGYAHKAKITFGGYTGESTLTNFPALVRLAENVGGFSYADCKLANGGDVRFTRGDGLELASECAKWDPSGESQFRVRIPELTAGTEIYVCWGNASATARNQALRVWDLTYTGVWSLDDEGKGIADSSGHGHFGTSTSDTTGADGVIGRYRSFDGTSDARMGRGFGTAADFLPAQMTYECWYKLPALPTATCPLLGMSMIHTGGSGNRPLRLLRLTNKGLPEFALQGQNFSSTGDAVVCEVWHQMMVTFDSEAKACDIYLDGARVGGGNYTKTEGWENADYLPFQLAYANYSGQSARATAALDEVRMSKVVRSADYVAAVYRNVADSANFMSVEGVDSLPAVEPLERKVRFVISAEEGGSVTPSGEVLVNEGETLEIKATDGAKAFYAWEGDCPTTKVFTASIRVAADRDRTLKARFGTPYYVSTEGADADTTGRTLAAAKATIKGALDQIEADVATDPSVIPAVVLVKEGTYALTSAWALKAKGEYQVNRPIAVRSVDGIGAAKIDFGNVEGRRSFYLNSSGAVVDGFQFVNVKEYQKSNDDNYGVAEIDVGHLLNCRVDAWSVGSWACGLVKVVRGWVSGCRFCNGTLIRTSGGNSCCFIIGEAALMDACIVTNATFAYMPVSCAGTIRNSLFADLTVTRKMDADGGAIACQKDSKNYETFKNVCIDNCTFVRCRTTRNGGAVACTVSDAYPYPACLVNCAFLENAALSVEAGHDFYGVQLFNGLSAYADNVNGNIGGVPWFEESRPGEYVPNTSSLARNKGAWLDGDGMATATDLWGTNRVEESAIDIGCSECPKPAHEKLGVVVQLDASSAVGTITVNFTTTVIGDATGVSYAWDFGDGKSSDEANPTHTYDSVGYYTVRLVVTNGAGETANYTGTDIVKVLPTTCFVRAVGASLPKAPYATPETAANCISDVMALRPAAVDLGEGDIPIGQTVLAEYAVRIVGKGPDKTTITGCGKDKSTGNLISLYVRHAEAVLTGVRFYNADCSNSPVMGLTAGVVTNCLFEKVKSNTSPVLLSGGLFTHNVLAGCWSDVDGNGGIVMDGPAQVVSCVISNGLSKRSNPLEGLAIRGRASGKVTEAAVVRNCLITGCTSTKPFDGVICSDFPVRIENCTIVSNAVPAGSTCAGIELVCDGCEVVNTISWGNLIAGTEETDAVESDLVVADGVTATLSHSCFAGATEPTCTGEDPRFCFGKPSSRPFYGIKSSSPCKDTGVKLGWMTDGATDLIGKPRVFGGVPDMGCYESLIGGLVIMFR